MSSISYNIKKCSVCKFRTVKQGVDSKCYNCYSVICKECAQNKKRYRIRCPNCNVQCCANCIVKCSTSNQNIGCTSCAEYCYSWLPCKLCVTTDLNTLSSTNESKIG